MENLTREEFSKIWISTKQISEAIPFLSYDTVKTYMQKEKFPFSVAKFGGRRYAKRVEVEEYVRKHLETQEKD